MTRVPHAFVNTGTWGLGCVFHKKIKKIVLFWKLPIFLSCSKYDRKIGKFQNSSILLFIYDTDRSIQKFRKGNILLFICDRKITAVYYYFYEKTQPWLDPSAGVRWPCFEILACNFVYSLFFVLHCIILYVNCCYMMMSMLLFIDYLL
jgi:hypothetical protein